MFVFIFVLFYSFYLIPLYANKKRVRKNGLLIGFYSISDVYSVLSNNPILQNEPYITECLYSRILLSLLLLYLLLYRIFSRPIVRRVFYRKAFYPLQHLPPSYSDKTLPPEAYFRQNLFPIRKYWRSLAEYCLHD